MTLEEELIELIIQKHGPVINIKDNPALLIDIARRLSLLRRTAEEPPDGGTPCGGVPSPPPPPPSPSGIAARISLEDVMKQMLSLEREIISIKDHLGIKVHIHNK